MNRRTGDPSDDIAYPSAIAFLLVHLACLAAFWTGVTGVALLLGGALYLLRMFAITAGYHRYFSHRAFRTSRAFQFVLAFLAQTSAQKGPLWWAAHHRRHHQYSDTELDVHSPAQRGFFYAHVGWIFVPRNNPTDHAAVQDLGKFKELLWLDRHPYLPAALLAATTWLIAGWPGLVVGFCWSTVAVWHATFSINSLAHVFGRRRYVTGDDSRNNWWLALLTLGEGWHNNHHACQVSARQGFRWWEYDPTYYALRVLSWLRIVWDLRAPPQALMLGEQKLGRHVIDKVAGQLAASFPVNQIASQALETLARAPGWTEAKLRLASAGMRAELFWNNIDLPDIPTLEEVRRFARERLSQTPSLDEIAVRARERLLELVYSRLREAVTVPAAG
ncbi:Acyl-CoA desaturase [Rhodovastum atsumiense]|uniref:Acyl-CoA desaturase n=1 Tax=Rhodovastum atsumiense TaxID=504468 RepID=A0A5M6IRE0_9PROT|nr:acyl-CoA desaturase [Rhodovastum atsumiense]KAA5610834.1 acyl-CoA desaturase [Rhodovastum atsumiense]CAH2602119.1 Acyl-CoA desaturase [Rhodovastum atsumiense]